jgi:hypothetical protein
VLGFQYVENPQKKRHIHPFLERSEDAQLLVSLFTQFLGVGFLGCGGFDRLGLVGTLTGIDVAIGVFDVGVFAQLSEVGAERGL